MKLMLRNLFHIPLRIVERKSTNGEVEYWCQYQNIFGKWKNRTKYDMFGIGYYAVFYSFEDAYEFNYGKKEEEKVKVVDSCYKKRF